MRAGDREEARLQLSKLSGDLRKPGEVLLLHEGIPFNWIRNQNEWNNRNARECDGCLCQCRQEKVDVLEGDRRVGVCDGKGLSADVWERGWVSRVFEKTLFVE